MMARMDPVVLDQLRTVDIFADLPDEDLVWFVERSELQDAGMGEIVFVEGEPADTMFVLLTGEIHGRREQDGRIFPFAAGDLSGVLPFSRMKEWGGTGRAIIPSRLLRFPKEKFAELLDRIPMLEPRLVAYMTDRVRDFTRREQQEEKLISLGRLSAGLAHELNNPAAAAQRAAAGLADAFCEAQRWTARLARRVEPEVMERLPELPLTLDPTAASKLDPLARSDREDEITDWLDAQGAEDAWRIAPTLVEAGADLPWLERFGEGIPADELPFALAWLEVTLRAEELLNTIEQATGRISNLVGDVKRYTYMDRAPVQEVDVREGLDTTLRVLAHKLHQAGLAPTVAVGNDYRSYSLAIKQALMLGLIAGGARVHDIGVALSPMAYFAQFDLDTQAVAMVTASHNPNGWTGVKIGMERPLTHGPDEMARLRDIVLGGQGVARPGGAYLRAEGVRERYIADLAGDFRLSRPLKVICATGNGTAGAFAPDLLRRIGAEVVPLHDRLDYTFPNYNPNPEAMEMLHDMGRAVRESGADLALGFDGDGDRCGVVDDQGDEIFADKVGVLLAREWVRQHPGARFLADIKSTGLFASDPELVAAGASVEYWKTGHSHMKRRMHETGALAGLEKSGHHCLAPPIGRGYDDGLLVAVEICRMLDRHPGRSMSDLKRSLPRTWATPTMSPFCPDEEKYAVAGRLTERLVAMKGGRLGPLAIEDVVTVNGARVVLKDGAWALVRPSSNTPNLVVVAESTRSEDELRAIFAAIDAIIREEPAVGAYDQTF